MPTPTPRQPQPAPLPPGSPRHARAASEPTDSAPDDSSPQTLLQQRLQGAFLTVIGLAGLIGGVLFSIEAPRFTPVPVVFLTFWLVMVIVGKILFAGLRKLRDAGVSAPAPSQVRAAAAVAGIVVAVGMMGFAATGTGAGVAAGAPCPGGGPATCGPDPGAPTLTFTPPPAQTGTPGGQQGGQQSGQDQQGIATSPAGSGGDNGPGIQAQTPEFGIPGQQAPNIPGNEQPGQGGGQQQGQQPQGNGQGQQNQSPVRTTAPGGPQQTGQQQPGQQTQSGQPSSPTVTVTQTESQCAVPGAGNGAGAPGGPGNGDSSNNGGGTGPDNGDGEQKDGAPSWAYLVGEVTALMTGRRGRKAGPLNKDGSAPTNKMVPGDQIDGENYKQWTTPDGDRTYILSENENAPSQYRFTLNQPPGGSSKVNNDGSVSVFDRDGNQVNRFDTPWAYDSVTGEKIPTRYSLDGNDLVQTIDRPEGNNNPILADPNPDGTPTLEESMAALSAPTTYGPYTPEQAAARATAAQAAEQQRLAATLAQPVTQAQQPPINPPYSTPPEQTVPSQKPVASQSANSAQDLVAPLISEGTKPAFDDPTAAVLNQAGGPQISQGDGYPLTNPAKPIGVSDVTTPAASVASGFEAQLQQSAKDAARRAATPGIFSSEPARDAALRAEEAALGRTAKNAVPIPKVGGALLTAAGAIYDMSNGTRTVADAAGNTTAATVGGLAGAALLAPIPGGAFVGGMIGSYAGGLIWDNKDAIANGAVNGTGKVIDGVKSGWKNLFG